MWRFYGKQWAETHCRTTLRQARSARAPERSEGAGLQTETPAEQFTYRSVNVKHPAEQFTYRSVNVKHPAEPSSTPRRTQPTAEASSAREAAERHPPRGGEPRASKRRRGGRRSGGAREARGGGGLYRDVDSYSSLRHSFNVSSSQTTIRWSSWYDSIAPKTAYLNRVSFSLK